jgi:hypothetical protein
MKRVTDISDIVVGSYWGHVGQKPYMSVEFSKDYYEVIDILNYGDITVRQWFLTNTDLPVPELYEGTSSEDDTINYQSFLDRYVLMPSIKELNDIRNRAFIRQALLQGFENELYEMLMELDI